MLALITPWHQGYGVHLPKKFGNEGSLKGLMSMKMIWPSQSPTLYPLKHLWDISDLRTVLRQRTPLSSSKNKYVNIFRKTVLNPSSRVSDEVLAATLYLSTLCLFCHHLMSLEELRFLQGLLDLCQSAQVRLLCFKKKTVTSISWNSNITWSHWLNFNIF